MFGFKRRARERAAAEAAKVAAISSELSHVFADTLADLLVEVQRDSPNISEPEWDGWKMKADAVMKGVAAVLAGGRDAYGDEEIRSAALPIRQGAIFAHGALNVAVILGHIDKPKIREDMRFAILGRR
jgi:hypothetical protein